MVDANGVPQIKDFSFSIEPIPFTINDDLFNAAPELPLGVLQMATKISSSQVQELGIEPVLEVFDEILLDDSATRFRARVFDKAKPISMQRHIMPILNWLFEEWGLRPPAPSEPSLATSDGTGTSSTDGAPSEESIPSTSDSSDSSTSPTAG